MASREIKNQTKQVKKTQKKPKTNKKKTQKPKKKRRVKWKNIFLAIMLLFVTIYGIYYIFNVSITNIYVVGNRILTDQQVIELAEVEYYPGLFDVMKDTKNNLEQSPLIKKAKIHLDFLKLTIKVEENEPLFYDSNLNKTILSNGEKVDVNYNVPILLNYIPDTIYSLFLKAMNKIDYDIIERISEIKYDPDSVDDSRFLLSMRDGNYVYLTITKWDSLNSYVSIIKKFPNEKGIIYLNAGNSFEVFE